MVDYVTLLKSVLVVVVGWALKLLLTTIGVEIDEPLFNTLVAAIVAWFLTLFTVNTGQNVRAYFVSRKAK